LVYIIATHRLSLFGNFFVCIGSESRAVGIGSESRVVGAVDAEDAEVGAVDAEDAEVVGAVDAEDAEVVGAVDAEDAEEFRGNPIYSFTVLICSIRYSDLQF
jgi:hypothetical protein